MFKLLKTNIIVVITFFSANFISAQFAEKQIENFSSIYTDSLRFICNMPLTSGGCYNCTSTTASHIYDSVGAPEGAEYVRLNYNMIGGNGINEYARVLPDASVGVRPYYFSDLNYEPYGISIQVKGELGNTDKFRILLLEDADLDLSVWDSEKAFKYINDTVLGQPYWQNLIIPYSAFSPLTTGIMDLKRIRGYTFDILNISSTPHSGSVCFDDLRQLTTAVPQKDSTAMNGTFLIYNSFMDNWTSQQWRTQIIKMKDICMEKVILQFTQTDNVSYYSGASGAWVTVSKNIVDSIVKAAELENFKVIFGLSTTSACSINNSLTNPLPCQEELDINKSIVNDLYSKFGNSPAFSGWYITKEFWDALNVPNQNFMSYYQELSAYCKSFDPSKSVSIAPAIFLKYPADVFADWMDNFLSNCPDIDIVYFQDMGGRLIADTEVDLPHYFSLLKAVCENHNIKFGVDIETFHEQNTCDGILYNYRTKTLEEFKKQLYVASVYSDEIVNYVWQYFYLYGPQLYNDYKNWLETNSICDNQLATLKNEIDFSYSIYPNPTSNYLYIQAKGNLSNINLKIIDVYGKVMKASKNIENPIDVSNFDNGIYFLIIEDSEKIMQVLSFIKQN